MSDPETRRARILFLHKDASFGRWLDSRLSGRNALVTSATTVEHAARALRLQAYDVLVVDRGLTAIERANLLGEMPSQDPPLLVIAPSPPISLIESAPLRAAAEGYAAALLRLAETAVRLSREVEALEPVRHAEDHDSLEPHTRQGVRALVEALESREPFEPGGTERLAGFATAIAERLGGFDLDRIRLGAELMNVGNLGVPMHIWETPGALEPEDREQVRRHPLVALQMLKPIIDDPILLAGIVWHHERWDGRGYPDGLRGPEIPRIAQVLGLAETLNALLSRRSHRPAITWADAIEEIESERGGQFGPEVVDGLLEIEDDLRREYAARLAD